MGHETVGSAALDRWLRAFADAVSENADALTALDSAIGDADHGSNMRRGMTAVVGKLDAAADASPSALLKAAGMTLVSTVGGASGPLYGTFFLRMATAAGDRTELDAAGLAAALRAGLDGVVARGKAAPGDKTMLDALVPAVDALDAALSFATNTADPKRGALLQHVQEEATGISTLLVFWELEWAALDDELLRLWDAPINTAAFRWGV